jgi:hypothetical protein
MDQDMLKNDTGDLSLRDLVAKARLLFIYIKSKTIIIIVAGVIGASLGYGYARLKKPVYTAECTFVLEEGGKGGGLGQYSGLASIAGIDVGGGGNIFQGDNILELYKSRSMIEKTLLTKVRFGSKDQLLIDRYIEFNRLRNKWDNNEATRGISFNGNSDEFSRVQDSIVTDIVNTFNTSFLFVTKPDRKLSIIDVDFSSKDELFAKKFTDQLVDNVNNFYVFTKTKKAQQSVLILQHQADSVRGRLDMSLNGVASSIDATPNANPNMVALRVPAQKKQVDVQANTAIYSEMVKNLETSKYSLRQETPLIQVIDRPVLPLSVNHLGKTKGAVIGFALSALLTIMLFVAKRIWDYLML